MNSRIARMATLAVIDFTWWAISLGFVTLVVYLIAQLWFHSDETVLTRFVVTVAAGAAVKSGYIDAEED